MTDDMLQEWQRFIHALRAHGIKLRGVIVSPEDKARLISILFHNVELTADALDQFPYPKVTSVAGVVVYATMDAP